MREAKERPFQPSLFGGPKELPIELPEPMPEPAIAESARVTLDPEEEQHVWKVALAVAARYEKGHDERGKKARMKYLPPGVTIAEMVVHGLAAELAVAVYLGLPWNEGKRGKPDVGGNVEVRQTRFSDGVLTLHSWDKLDRIFILAIGRMPSFMFAGWIPGADGVGLGDYYPPGTPYPYRLGQTGTASSTGVWTVKPTLLRPMTTLPVRRPEAPIHSLE